MFHVRADMGDADAARLARAFRTNLIVPGEGPSGMLRHEATEADISTLTLGIWKAHRCEGDLIDHALDGVRSVFAK